MTKHTRIVAGLGIAAALAWPAQAVRADTVDGSLVVSNFAVATRALDGGAGAFNFITSKDVSSVMNQTSAYSSRSHTPVPIDGSAGGEVDKYYYYYWVQDRLFANSSVWASVGGASRADAAISGDETFGGTSLQLSGWATDPAESSGVVESHSWHSQATLGWTPGNFTIGARTEVTISASYVLSGHVGGLTRWLPGVEENHRYAFIDGLQSNNSWSVALDAEGDGSFETVAQLNKTNSLYTDAVGAPLHWDSFTGTLSLTFVNSSDTAVVGTFMADAHLWGAAATAPPVPEAGTFAMLACGLAVLGLGCRRSRTGRGAAASRG